MYNDLCSNNLCFFIRDDIINVIHAVLFILFLGVID